ncbi:hypothetical protein BV22DRAFT_1028166 [Leucogyrophana mollusca]|uniref:Uncharacterized protein n=1 Tax=Leucogyrophana mollusca TaxID=85980 RepID=A0ACB8BYP2_9AGAM|nr:hypothetical protein BV22DRAFT_1028166 [Leucogyrophana mollusca]
MSTFYPHVNLPALKKFAIATAAAEHPARTTTTGGGARRLIAKPKPEVSSVEDVVWAGEKMIQINFERASLPLGPYCMVAHFPRGRPRLTTQALVGMTATVRSAPMKIDVPKVYGYKDVMPNDIGAEVVLLEKIPGEGLDALWPNMSHIQEMKVCIRLTELLLNLFNYRGALICTDLQGTGINTRPASVLLQDEQQRQPPIGQHPVLLSRPFNEGPLASMPPPCALPNTESYLIALACRIERLFDGTAEPQVADQARDTGFPDNPPLSDTDIAEIRETWGRLRSLIPYHTGGFYIPGSLSFPARQMAYSVLQSRRFGIYHSDMQMERFIVRFLPNKDGSIEEADAEIEMTLCTGWEHAFRAPLWSCARMPLWLVNRFITNEPVSWSRQAYLRRLIFFMMNDQRLRDKAWEWIIAYIFGVPERWFEGCLSAHWMFGKSIEVLLVRLKAYWEAWRPDVPFPLIVGEEFRPRRTPAAAPPNGSVPDSETVSAPGGEELDSTQELFNESFEALIRAAEATQVEQGMAQ